MDPCGEIKIPEADSKWQIEKEQKEECVVAMFHLLRSLFFYQGIDRKQIWLQA